MKNIFFAVAGLFLITACSTTKFDYNTAYKFSQQEQEQIQSQVQRQNQLMASKKPVPPRVESLPPDQAILSPALKKDASATSMEHYKNATKTEKKAIRKQVKEEYKTLRKQVKKAKNEAATKDVVFNKKMYIGLIIFGAGLLVAILASGPIGAVGIIVGIGLIAWGFIEQA